MKKILSSLFQTSPKQQEEKAQAYLRLIQSDQELLDTYQKKKYAYTPKPILATKKFIIKWTYFFEFVFGIGGVLMAKYVAEKFTGDILGDTSSDLLVVVALFGLLVWEILKHIFVDVTLKDLYVEKKVNIIFGILAVVTVGVSIHWSTTSINQWNNEKNASSPPLISIDSLNSIYIAQKKEAISRHDADIKNVENQEDSYKRSVTWAGRVDITNSTTKKKLADYSLQLTALRTAKEKELKDIRAERKEQLTKAELFNQKQMTIAQKKTSDRGKGLWWLAFLFDILVVVMILVRKNTEYHGVKQIDKAQKVVGKNMNLSPTLSPHNISKPFLDHSKGLTKKEKKIYKMYIESNCTLTKAQMSKSTGISRTIIDRVFNKTGLKYHRSQGKKVSTFPKEKSVHLAS